MGGGWLSVALAGLVAAGALHGGPWWLFGPAAAPALSAGALRTARRRPVDHSMPIIPTPGGALPIGPIIWALTGADLAALGCTPALLALSTPAPALGPYLVAQALSSAGMAAVFMLRRRAR